MRAMAIILRCDKLLYGVHPEFDGHGGDSERSHNRNKKAILTALKQKAMAIILLMSLSYDRPYGHYSGS